MENASAIMGIITTVLAGVILWKLRSQSEKNDKFAASITALENTAVSDEHVRKVIREEMQQLNATLPELIKSMNDVKNYIAEERGYKAGQAAALRRAGDTQL